MAEDLNSGRVEWNGVGNVEWLPSIICIAIRPYCSILYTLAGWASAWRLHTNLYEFCENISSDIPKSREVLGPCLLGSVLQSHDVLTQMGLGGLASSSLMLDGNR